MKYWAIATLCFALGACSNSGGSSSSDDTSDTGGGTPTVFTVTATAGTGGSISPASRSVNDGDTTTFTLTPDAGFSIDSVSGCSGSLSGNIYTTGAITANCAVTASFSNSVVTTGDRVVYIANDQSMSDTDGLYIVDTDGANPARLNPDLVAGGNVAEFVWSGDGTSIIYLADQDTDGRMELYSVLPDGSGVTKLNAALLDGAGVSDFSLSPTGDEIAYLAQQDTNGTTELYTVSIDGTNNVKVNDTLVSGGNVTDFMWSPDGVQLLYVSDLETNESFELYAVNLDGSNHQNVNVDLNAGEDLIDYRWSPLGGYISYQVIDRSDSSVTDLARNKTLYTFNATDNTNVAVIPASLIADVKWSDDDSHIMSAGVDGVTGLDLVNGAYGLIQVNGADGGALVSLTAGLPSSEDPHQFDFIAGSDDVVVLSDTGSFNSTMFYVLSSVDGSIIDMEPAGGSGGAFVAGTPNGDTSVPQAFYDALNYTPFTYSTDGRYVVINDFALSIYDTQTDALLELAAFNSTSSYYSKWIEADDTILYFSDDGSFEPVTFERAFIDPLIVDPTGAVIADIDQLLGGDDSVARGVNPMLLGDNNIAFERFPTAQRPLVTLGTDGLNLAVLSEETATEIIDYQLTSDGNNVIYSQGCNGTTPCNQSALYSVDLDGANRLQINPNIFTSTGIKAFAVQP